MNGTQMISSFDFIMRRFAVCSKFSYAQVCEIHRLHLKISLEQKKKIEFLKPLITATGSNFIFGY